MNTYYKFKCPEMELGGGGDSWLLRAEPRGSGKRGGWDHSQGFKGLVGVERERERKPLKTGDCLFFAPFTARPGPDLRLVFNARRVGDGRGSGGTQHAEVWGAREGRNKGILQELSESLKG